MAGRGSTSFLKRQKEQQRTARATAKRAARQARRDNRQTELTTDQVLDDGGSVEANEQTPEPDGNPTD